MNFDFQKMNDSNAGRYVFGITGQIKEIIYPSKAILGFKYNGKEEKAILLVHKLHVDNVPVEEHRLMSDFVKVGDIIDFDGHIYDKGGFGNSKDRCNYYAMRAWKASQSKVLAKEQMLNGKAGRPPLTVGTGWISEIFPRKGVLTFNNNGQDERVLFLASKVYIFEKRLGTKQSLDQVRQLKKNHYIHSHSIFRFFPTGTLFNLRRCRKIPRTTLTTVLGSPPWSGRGNDRPLKIQVLPAILGTLCQSSVVVGR